MKGAEAAVAQGEPVQEKDELERLADDIGRIISDNRKFLQRVMEEDFEPEEGEAEAGEEEPPEEL